MPACDYCGTTILFGGVKHGDLRFCNNNCANKSVLVKSAVTVSDDEVERQARAMHQGLCPKCSGPGPVDLHVSHRVY
jgi:hypothetical protein